jgi:hypothetical protein
MQKAKRNIKVMSQECGSCVGHNNMKTLEGTMNEN